MLGIVAPRRWSTRSIDFMDDQHIKPPGHTCPAIDSAQRTMRRLAWRIRNRPECEDNEVAILLAEGLAALERVRDENKQMRAAYYLRKSP